jgi:hypothetical protein
VATLISLGSTVLLATGQGTNDFKRGSREKRLARTPMVNGDGEYIKNLGRNGAIHRVVIRRQCLESEKSALYAVFDNLQSETEATLTVPGEPEIPYCVLIEEPDYSEQESVLYYSGGTQVVGYTIEITLTFLQTRG